MYDFFAQKKAKLSVLRLQLNTDSVPAFSVLLLLVGVVLGSVIGTYAENPFSPEFFSVSMMTVSESVSVTVWNSTKYLIILLLSATSYLGLVTIPAIILLRGYSFSCAAAAMFSSSSYRGMLYAFLVCGVPAILTLPPLMALSLDCFARSRHLLLLRFGKFGYPMRDAAYLKHFLAACLLTFAAVIYSSYILPHLLVLL